MSSVLLSFVLQAFLTLVLILSLVLPRSQALDYRGGAHPAPSLVTLGLLHGVIEPGFVLLLGELSLAELVAYGQPPTADVGVAAEYLYFLPAQTESLYDLVHFYGFLQGPGLPLLADYHIDVNIRMNEVVVGSFLGLALVADQAVLLDSGQDTLVTLRRRLLIHQVGLDPDNILASLEAPFLEQFPAVIQVLGAHPEENKRGRIGNVLDGQLQ